MAVFQFSALSDGQSIAFNPNTDVLNFDQTTVAAADLRVTAVGTSIRVEVFSGPQTGKDVTLQNVSPPQLATTNVTFADGSKLLFGDNSTAQNDNLANSLTGTAGRDLLQGFGGADTMNGGAGNDAYIVGAGDVLTDTGGVDTVVTDVDWTLGADFENVQMLGTGNIGATGNNGNNLAIGNSGNNYFNLRAGDDTIEAGAGNDWIDMSAFGTGTYGDDVIDGGAGTDTVNFAISAGQLSAITVDLGAGTIRGGGSAGFGSASVTSVERVIGAQFNDSMKGSGAAETLEGRDGNDTLSGMGGNDTLIGGTGQDTFLFATAPGTANADVVSDFVSGTDKLTFDNSVFAALGGAGGFAAGDARFAAGAGFTSGRDASDRLVYNTTTGQLFYDADGNGAGASQLVATLQGAPALAATDIVVTGAGGSNTISGTAGNDSLIGTEGDDLINGLGGNDTIEGRGGNDTLDGGDGDDWLFGQAGADLLRGGAGNDTLVNFRLTGLDEPTDTLDGGLGNDTYDLRTFGSTSNTVIVDAGGLDTILTNDSIVLPDGIENLTLFEAFTGTGNALDNVITSKTNEGHSYHLDGGDGNDTLLGGPDPDHFTFSAGSGNYGNDSVSGGDGPLDSLSFVGARSGVNLDMGTGVATGGGTAGSGSVTFSGIEFVVGSEFADRLTANDLGSQLNGFDGNDTLIGGAGNDLLSGDGGDAFTGLGGNGNDVVQAGGGDDTVSLQFGFGAGSYGSDTIDGGAGFDTLELAGFSDAVVDLSAGTVRGGGVDGAGEALVTSIEAVRGGSGLIIGSDVANRLEANGTVRGGAGDDTLVGFGELRGEDGNDDLTGGSLLSGGAGNDTLRGSFQSSDRFLFAEAPGSGNADNVLFFESGRDKIALDSAAHANLGAAGSFTAGDGRFFAAPGATSGHDTSDRVIYDMTSGNLFYDADGSGAGTSQLIATLSGAPRLLATDVDVVGEAGGTPIQGTAGNDSIVGTAGDDTIEGLDGNDTLEGLNGNDSLFGGNGADSLVGGDNDDTLDGGAGVDTLAGGFGDDVYFATPGDVLSDVGGTDQVISAGAWTLGFGFENLALTIGNGATGSGNELANVITASANGNTMDGRGGDDTLLGGAGADNILAGPGSDFIDAGDGNDFIHFVGGELGNDTINGGSGQDGLQFASLTASVTVDLEAHTLTIAGGASASVASIENLSGGSGNDFFIGDGNDNAFAGGAGNDTLVGGISGRDVLIGMDGDDFLDGGTGGDALTGGAGADRFAYSSSGFFADADLITDFQSGTDKLLIDNRFLPGLAPGAFAPGDGRFFAASGAFGGHDADDRIIYDTLSGDVFYDADGSGPDASARLFTLSNAAPLAATDIVITGQGGPVQGTAGNDSLTGTAGNDSMVGLAGADTLNGLGGDDTLDGGTGVDSLSGGLGNDSYIVTAGDVLTDAGGTDTVVSDISWTLGGDIENLTMTGTGNLSVTGNNAANFVNGNSGNNYFNLRAGNDTIQAGAGNDWIDMSAFGTPSYGDDIVNGGDGTDTVNFAISAGQQSAITVDLTAGSMRGGGAGGAGSATVTSIEHVIGAGFNDSIKGSAAAETLEGREGNDTLSGLGGNDTLTGGTGSDSFVFAAAPGAGNGDLVSDFVSGTDKAAFDNAVFTALGADGNFVAGDARFTAGAGFTSGHDASDRIVYNTTTGQLFYDADGSGAGAAQLVATFQGAPAIAATDITVM